MGYFVVINEQGPKWDVRLSMREQKGWDEHAKFMDALEAEHFIVLGGPLGNYPKHRAMLIINAPDHQTIRKRLDEDPWYRDDILREIQAYSWEILLGKLPETLVPD